MLKEEEKARFDRFGLGFTTSTFIPFSSREKSKSNNASYIQLDREKNCFAIQILFFSSSFSYRPIDRTIDPVIVWALC